MKYILFSIVAVFLAACNPVRPDPIIQVVESRKMVIASTDESLLLPCHETTPPSREEYNVANRDKKEAMLTTYIASLITDNKRCTLDKLTLKAILDKQILQIKRFNDEEDACVNALLNKKPVEEVK